MPESEGVVRVVRRGRYATCLSRRDVYGDSIFRPHDAPLDPAVDRLGGARGRGRTHCRLSGAIACDERRKHERRDGNEVGREKPRLHRRAGYAADQREDFVDDEELPLRADERCVAREGRRVLRKHDCGHVSSPVRDAVSIPGAISGRQYQEGEEACDNCCGESQKFGASSALGPYMAGTGTSFSRRYTPSCARWWIR